MKTILIAFISFSLCGCIWVDLSDEASNVRVLEAINLNQHVFKLVLRMLKS